MPRAFLIKKKQQCAKNGQSLSRTIWEEDSDTMDNSRDPPQFAPLTIVSPGKHNYNLKFIKLCMHGNDYQNLV